LPKALALLLVPACSGIEVEERVIEYSEGLHVE
jgi:hypothetical protein